MSKDMTEGKILKLMLLFFLPLLVGNLFQQLYNMVDTVIVGQFVGLQALGAVGATGSISFLIIGFVNGLTSGFSIPISQAYGAGDVKLVRHRIAMALYLCVGAAVVFTVCTLCTTRQLLILMRTPADIFEDAYRYIIIIFGGMATTIFYNMFSGILRSVGDSRSPLLFLTVASLLNVGLDLAFVAGLQMGVAGAALATVISQGTAALLCGRFIWKRFPMLRFERDELVFRWETVRHMLSSGVPMALQFSITAVGSIVLQTAVNSLGWLVVSSVTVSGKVQLLATMPMESLGLTMATFCGQNVGARRMERVHSGVRQGLLLGLGFALISTVLVFFWGHKLAGLFISPAQENLAEVLTFVREFLKVNAVCYPILAVLLVLRNSIQGMGFSGVTMFAGVGEMAARAGVAFWLVIPFGFSAICFANPTAWLAADVFLVFFYFRTMRKLEARLAATAGTV